MAIPRDPVRLTIGNLSGEAKLEAPQSAVLAQAAKKYNHDHGITKEEMHEAFQMIPHKSWEAFLEDWVRPEWKGTGMIDTLETQNHCCPTM